jgi:hypothetical protein
LSAQAASHINRRYSRALAFFDSLLVASSRLFKYFLPAYVELLGFFDGLLGLIEKHLNAYSNYLNAFKEGKPNF